MSQLKDNVVETAEHEAHPANDKEYWVKDYNVTNCCQFLLCGKGMLFMEAEHISHTSTCLCGCCKDKTQNEFAELSLFSCCGCCNCIKLSLVVICPGCCGIGYNSIMKEIGELVEIRKKTHGAHAQIQMLETLVGKVDGIESDVRKLRAMMEAKGKPDQLYMDV
eukprot:Platyproteum_vivax@DN6769_c0_g1_i4.p1